MYRLKEYPTTRAQVNPTYGKGYDAAAPQKHPHVPLTMIPPPQTYVRSLPSSSELGRLGPHLYGGAFTCASSGTHVN